MKYHDLDAESEPATAENEAEVTPEMIEAGMDAWIASDKAYEKMEKTIVRIFVSMLNRQRVAAAASAGHHDSFRPQE